MAVCRFSTVQITVDQKKPLCNKHCMERNVVIVVVIIVVVVGVVVVPTRSQIFADTSEPGRIRGRQKYPTYQGNFRGRKSNSLMNLCGKKF